MDDFGKKGGSLCKTVEDEPKCEIPSCPHVYMEQLPAPEECVPLESSCGDMSEKSPLPEVGEKVPLPDKNPLLAELDADADDTTLLQLNLEGGSGGKSLVTAAVTA